MRRFISILILCIGIYMNADAQTYTERVQKKVEGQGTVTIHQSDEIDQLVNDPTATGVQSQGSSNNNNDKKPTTPSKGNEQAKNENGQPSGSGNGEEATTQRRTSQKVSGYRVQAFAGGNTRKDRQMAEQARNNIKAHFSNVSVDVHFYSPRWICRVGNYRTYEEAHQMMVALQNLGYKQASIVKSKVSVQY